MVLRQKGWVPTGTVANEAIQAAVAEARQRLAEREVSGETTTRYAAKLAKTEAGQRPEACKRRAIRIRKLMLEQGVTQADMARELGCGKQYVNNTVSGREEAPRVREHLARRLGVSVDELWSLDVLDQSRPRRATATASRRLDNEGEKRRA